MKLRDIIGNERGAVTLSTSSPGSSAATLRDRLQAAEHELEAAGQGVELAQLAVDAAVAKADQRFLQNKPPEKEAVLAADATLAAATRDRERARALVATVHAAYDRAVAAEKDQLRVQSEAAMRSAVAELVAHVAAARPIVERLFSATEQRASVVGNGLAATRALVNGAQAVQAVSGILEWLMMPETLPGRRTLRGALARLELLLGAQFDLSALAVDDAKIAAAFQATVNEQTARSEAAQAGGLAARQGRDRALATTLSPSRS